MGLGLVSHAGYIRTDDRTPSRAVEGHLNVGIPVADRQASARHVDEAVAGTAAAGRMTTEVDGLVGRFDSRWADCPWTCGFA